jgi:LCP family protein required for cell wall assembly
MPEEGEQPAEQPRKDPPEYNVYRSRPGLRDRFSKPGLDGLKAKLGDGDGGDGDDGKPPKPPKMPGETPDRPLWRRILKWVGIVALGWIVLSLLAFAISSQIQKGKLANGIGDELNGNPFMAVSPQTILVLGTDVRSEDFAGPAESEGPNCLEDVTSGKGDAPACDHGPYRSDTIMLIRAGGGTFRKLSIPRDTLANVPGHGEQKINSAYAAGGAKLTIRTVEGLLGIDIDQIAIIDFDGFRKFIDTIGGIDVDLPTPVCSTVSAGAFNLKLDKGENHLDGFQAITLARTRDNTCSTGSLAGQGDLERAQFQQLILDGIKGRLTSITSLPMNFLKGPIIGWEAPKTMVSSMGGLTMPQLALSAVLGGGGGTDILKPSGSTAAGNLVVSPGECERAAETLLGEKPPRQPNCPQS